MNVQTIPLPPESFVDDAWMNNLESRKAYDQGLLELDQAWKQLTDALDASEMITEHDLRLVINAR